MISSLLDFFIGFRETFSAISVLAAASLVGALVVEARTRADFIADYFLAQSEVLTEEILGMVGEIDEYPLFEDKEGYGGSTPKLTFHDIMKLRPKIHFLKDRLQRLQLQLLFFALFGPRSLRERILRLRYGLRNTYLIVARLDSKLKYRTKEFA